MRCWDKNGRPFRVRPYQVGDDPLLLAMYRAFSPKGKYQGMPPGEEALCKLWLDKLLLEGENFLAWRGTRVIGHSVLLPDRDKGDAEYLVFVLQTDRGIGVGSELTRAAIQQVPRLGLERIWLTVDGYNFRAIRLYRKFGFDFTDPFRSDTERMMCYPCEVTNGG